MMDEEYNDGYDDTPPHQYNFEPEKIYIVLNSMKRCKPLLNACETEDLCDLYKKLFPLNNHGMYDITPEHLDELEKAMHDQILLELVDRGLLEMGWDGEANDFTFRLTEEGVEKSIEIREAFGNAPPEEFDDNQ